MKVIKRNQLVILVIGLMLVTAGYLNFIERQEKTASASSELEIADLGDATLVNSGELVENEHLLESSITEEEKIETQENAENQETTPTATKEATSNEYFSSTKLQRDTIYSQILETYQKMLDSTTISAEQKSIAQNEITKINNTKNAIMIAENLIKTKGFKDVVILVNEESVNVIINAEELKQEEIAQIQNIIAREMKADIENIHISNK